MNNINQAKDKKKEENRNRPNQMETINHERNKLEENRKNKNDISPITAIRPSNSLNNSNGSSLLNSKNNSEKLDRSIFSDRPMTNLNTLTSQREVKTNDKCVVDKFIDKFTDKYKEKLLPEDRLRLDISLNQPKIDKLLQAEKEKRKKEEEFKLGQTDKRNEFHTSINSQNSNLNNYIPPSNNSINNINRNERCSNIHKKRNFTEMLNSSNVYGKQKNWEQMTKQEKAFFIKNSNLSSEEKDNFILELLEENSDLKRQSRIDEVRRIYETTIATQATDKLKKYIRIQEEKEKEQEHVSKKFKYNSQSSLSFCSSRVEFAIEASQSNRGTQSVIADMMDNANLCSFKSTDQEHSQVSQQVEQNNNISQNQTNNIQERRRNSLNKHKPQNEIREEDEASSNESFKRNLQATTQQEQIENFIEKDFSVKKLETNNTNNNFNNFDNFNNSKSNEMSLNRSQFSNSGNNNLFSKENKSQSVLKSNNNHHVFQTYAWTKNTLNASSNVGNNPPVTILPNNSARIIKEESVKKRTEKESCTSNVSNASNASNITFDDRNLKNKYNFNMPVIVNSSSKNSVKSNESIEVPVRGENNSSSNPNIHMSNINVEARESLIKEKEEHLQTNEAIDNSMSNNNDRNILINNEPQIERNENVLQINNERIEPNLKENLQNETQKINSVKNQFENVQNNKNLNLNNINPSSTNNFASFPLSTINSNLIPNSNIVDIPKEGNKGQLLNNNNPFLNVGLNTNKPLVNHFSVLPPSSGIGTLQTPNFNLSQNYDRNPNFSSNNIPSSGNADYFSSNNLNQNLNGTRNNLFNLNKPINEEQELGQSSMEWESIQNKNSNLSNNLGQLTNNIDNNPNNNFLNNFNSNNSSNIQTNYKLNNIQPNSLNNNLGVNNNTRNIIPNTNVAQFSSNQTNNNPFQSVTNTSNNQPFNYNNSVNSSANNPFLKNSSSNNNNPPATSIMSQQRLGQSNTGVNNFNNLTNPQPVNNFNQGGFNYNQQSNNSNNFQQQQQTNSFMPANYNQQGSGNASNPTNQTSNAAYWATTQQTNSNFRSYRGISKK